jgi:DNA-binding transcriptional LysR family regulator
MKKMEPAAQIARIWNWLPAFRVVAETEHLPTASKVLHVTPSALSRTVRLLEQELGRELFHRVGRRIELTESGEHLLARLRDGMRCVYTGWVEALGATLTGDVHIATAGLMTIVYVQPALVGLRGSHAALIPHLHAARPDLVAEQLLRGEIHVAFLCRSVRHPRLTTEHLGEESSGVYCGPGHPLFRKRKFSRADILEHEFTAPLPDASGETDDGWPAHLRRRVALYASHMEMGVRACEQGDLLTVLPDVIGRERGLRRLPFDDISPVHLYAMHRPLLGPDDRAAVVLEAVRAQLPAGATR